VPNHNSTRPHLARLTPFGHEQRPAIVEALAVDPDLLAAADAESATTGLPRDAVRARIRPYAEEIVPHFSARLHHRIAYRLARRVATILYRVRVGHVDRATVEAIPADASVIFVINHRSNMDYVLVAFLAAERVALSFAVGEWARIWPLDSLLRALGAFFVRRDSHDRLYRKVLERYVQMAVDHGVTQGVFPEGGLSRDGKLRPAKLGLLAYASRRFSRSSPRDLVFVPVAVNYDRVLEDRTLIGELDPAARRPSRLGTTLGALAWAVKNTGLYVRGRLHRFGYACVNFGPPVSLRSYLDERGLDLSALSDDERRLETERLAALLMHEIAAIVPVTPVSLVAWALLSFDDGVAREEDLAGRVAALVEELGSLGAHTYIPRRDATYFFSVGARMLTLRRLVVLAHGVYRLVPDERPLVQYYSNSIAHFLATRTAPASPVHSSTRPHAERAVVLVHGLARTFRSMARIQRALEESGYTVYNWDYPSRRFGVMALVDALEEYARAVASSTDRLDFVTHSMGGLLARGVLARSSIANAGRLVMLAPPNQGAALASRASEFAWARGFYGQALEDLSPTAGDGLTVRLGAPACPFGVIAGTRSFHPLQPTSYYSSLTRPAGSHDGTVGVEETQLAGMADFVTVKANHTFIMDHDEAIRQTLHFLERGRFSRST
jgi:glycerol-3-phosphate O-acyltransferase